MRKVFFITIQVSPCILLLVLLSGCATPHLIHGGPSSAVRKVNFAETPELADWTCRAKQLGDEVYPKLVALLTDESAEPARKIDIVFKKRLFGDNRGVAIGRTVYLYAFYFTHRANSASSYTKQPENFEKVLVHEMAHVAEARGLRHYTKKSPGYWCEGIADYARYKMVTRTAGAVRNARKIFRIIAGQRISLGCFKKH